MYTLQQSGCSKKTEIGYSRGKNVQTPQELYTNFFNLFKSSDEGFLTFTTKLPDSFSETQKMHLINMV